MLDDVFGNLEFDQGAWSKWKQMLKQLLEGQEHRSLQQEKAAKENEVTVILVGRDYVLNSTSSDLGRIANFFTNKRHVVYMSSTTERDLNEKQAIWEAISESSGVKLDRITVDTICRINVPHGFPHVCRLFATLYKEDRNISAEGFFKSPLEFLNQTVQKFIHDKIKVLLLKEMIKRNGKISVSELEDFEDCIELVDAAQELDGSYLKREDEYFVFDHPSIYDSVAFHLCKYMPLFVIENCNLPFIYERIRLQTSRSKQQGTSNSESALVVDIPRSRMKNLAKRFAIEISNRNLLHVLSHNAMTDEQFIKELMSNIQVPLAELIQFTDVQTGQNFFSLTASNKSPELLKYIDSQTNIQMTENETNSVFYGVCRYAATDVLTYMLETREDLHVNVTYGNKQTPLMIAAESSESELVLRIMSLHPDLTASDRDGKTVLHYLCEHGIVSAVEAVANEGTDIDVVDCYGSPLWYACRSNQVEVVRLLLDRGAKVDAKAVVEACRGGNTNIVTLLFEKGATADMTTISDTPLIAACEGGHVNLVSVLTEMGVSVNADALGKSPLHWSYSRNKPDVVQCLLEHGADKSQRDEEDCAPIHSAAERGYTQCVEVLLKAGADVNVQNGDGDTPLHLALLDGSKHCIHVLLKAGADVHSKNIDDYTPLHTAVKFGKCKENVDALLSAGTDVNMKNASGDTPLHLAAARGSADLVDALLKAGGDVNGTNKHGQTPVHMALNYNSYLPDVSVCQTLVKHGADLNRQDDEGNSPLHLLCRVDSDTMIDKDLTYLPASIYEDVYRTLVTFIVGQSVDTSMLNNRKEAALHGWCQTLLQHKSKRTKNKCKD